ncbi:biopolymer transporter ExbD [bacterium]|nr:biopolymer transporter ExbD [bacterium]
MSEEIKTFEYLPENYEEEILKSRKKAKEGRSSGGPQKVNINSLMDILTIMLVFLLKSYATDPVNITPGPDLDIPKSTSMLQPAATVTITVAKSSIVVDNEPVSVVKDGKVEASQKRGGEDAYFIIPLNKALVEAVEKKRRLEAINPTVKFDGVATIVMDKESPYRLLTEVMYTAGQAEFTNFKFATISAAG